LNKIKQAVMSEFDTKARDWDSNPDHLERSEAITRQFLKMVPLKPEMTAMEYGAGTGIMSFLLAKHFSQITLMDNSSEMINVMNEKVASSGLSHLKPIFFDLEKKNYLSVKFDCIYTQMAMHHVNDMNGIAQRFFDLLKPGGYLTIADLYAEDGSFHGEGFTGHNGFDVTRLQSMLGKIGFHQTVTQQCYTIKKIIDEKTHSFPIFLMVSMKPI
jgi:ubiquinone/menaquinone biosynthesis C-methylase UbiE